MSTQGSLLTTSMLTESASHKDAASEAHYKLPELPDLSREPALCIDLETNDPGIRDGVGVGTRRGGYICGIGVGTPEKQWYFPIRQERGPNLDEAQVLNWCRDTFKNPQQDKLFANALYDLDYLYAAGVEVKGRYIDVQVAEPLIDENRSSYSLNSLAFDYLGQTKTEEDLYLWLAQVFGGKPTRKQAGNIWRAPAWIVEPYAHSDCYLPFPIYEKQKAIIAEQGLQGIFDIETGIIPILLAMRQRGSRFDEQRAEEVRLYMLAEENAIEAQLAILAGKSVDIWAAASIAELFEKLGLPYKKTATGLPSFTADWLKASDQRIANLIYQARRWNKARTTFIEGLLRYTTGGRIHTEFNQLRRDDAGAVSGRFSCSNPNLQNQPSRDPEMLHLIRSLFIPEEGERFVSLDYSQVEFRVLTHYGDGSSAETAQAMYNENPNTDFHTMVAELTGMKRTDAKNVTFALAYGAGVGKLASMVGCSRDEAKRMFDTYHARLPFLKQLSDLAGSVAANRGYVKTLLGRRRRFNKWEPRDFELAQQSEPVKHALAVQNWGATNIKRSKTHTALNAISQGTAADIAKKAMLDIWESGVCDVAGVPLTLVHDEINFSIPRGKEGDEAIREIKRLMENTVQLKIPLMVGVKEGAHWGECK